MIRKPSLLSRRGMLGVIAGAATTTAAFPEETRSTAWAVPVAMEGVDNLHRITPLLYRSAQPNALGFRNLADFGIKTIISVRQTVDDAAMARWTGLTTHRIPMKARDVGEDQGEKIVRVMRLLLASLADGPVLVHCHHGADRTGAISAVYRMVVQGWTNAAAVDELLNGDYGFHTIWQNIPRYVTSVDAEDLRRRIEAS
jgi:protein tyrosine/serine phosphatase